MCKSAQPALALLHRCAAFVDRVAHQVDDHAHDGQRGERPQGEFHVHMEHEGDAHHEEHGEVDGVHHRRAEVHAHLAHILAYAVHEVAGTVAFVEGAVQLLVVREHVVLQVVFDQAAHHDDRLPLQEKEEALHQGNGQIQDGQSARQPEHRLGDLRSGAQLAHMALKVEAGPTEP